LAAHRTGPLTVQSGNFVLDLGASWGGTNLVVSGGTLKVCTASANPFTAVDAKNRAEATLEFSGSGRLNLEDGVAASVKYASTNGVFVGSGTYSSAEGVAAGKASNPLSWLDGLGVLTVRKNAPGLGLVVFLR